MRILGWMHRKLRQSSPPDTLKEFHNGRASVDGCKPAALSTMAASNHYGADYLKPFPGFPFGKEDGEEEAMSDLFTHWPHEFLTIGTLGLLDPVEPKLDFEAENQKPLENESHHVHVDKGEEKKENASDGGSGVCQVDANKTVDVTATNHVWSTYSLNPVHDPVPVDGSGSRVEIEKVAVANKKECRLSLGDLFSKGKPSSKDSGDSETGPECKVRKMDRPEPKAPHLAKKRSKRQTRSSKTSTCMWSETVTPPEKKMHKLFQMFSRKVHPLEKCLVTTKKCPSEEIKNRDDFDIMLDDKDNFIHVDPITGKEKLRRHKSQPTPPAFTICVGDSNGNREYWVKTDADYFVLEL